MKLEGSSGHWAEMERLIEGMSEAARRRGRCYGVSGPIGVGKTFLMRKVEKAADSLGFRVLRGQAEAGAGPRAVFSALLPSPVSLLSEQQVPSLVVERIVETSARSPVLVALEDLHMADPTTVSVLILLARNVVDLPAMLVFSYDSDVIGASCGDVHPLLQGMRILAREGMFDDVRIQNMDRSTLIKVVEEELESSLDDSLADLIWERSEGNPMVAIEATRLLVQARQVERRDGRWTALRSVQLELPNEYHAMIRSRMDMLSPGDREMLTTAAVVGSTFDPWVIAKLHETDILEVLERLDRVAREQKLLEDDGEHYRFSARGVRSVLLEGLPLHEQMARHARIAKVLEGNMMGDAPFDDLSEHYYRAERMEKCVCFSLLAGNRALSGGDPQGARVHFQKVLDATDGGGFEEERLFSLEGIADVEMALGRPGLACSWYDEVLRRSPSEIVGTRVREKLSIAQRSSR